MPLSDTAVRNAKVSPDGKLIKLSDGNGLFLWLMPNGAKYWRLSYRFEGKQKTLACGVYPDTSLKMARERRDEARQHLAAGRDPSALKKAAKLEQELTVQNTFEAVAREWHTNEQPRWSSSHTKRVIESLETDAFPTIGSTGVADLTPPVVLNVLRQVEKRGAIETAQRLLQRISAVMRYAIQTALLHKSGLAPVR